jgi:hypothetical protein
MVSSSIDHMVALTIFIAATLLFIGLFGQSIQTAVVYQNNRATAVKASDLLDSMLLNPGTPTNWGRTETAPTVFGLQSSEFTQYRLDPYSLMRLETSSDPFVSYNNAGDTRLYSNLTQKEYSYLYMAKESMLNYSTAVKMLGVNDTYGFQLTITPIVTVKITEVKTNSPLSLSLQVDGVGFPVANAKVNYKLYHLVLNNDQQYPSFNIINGTTTTDSKGSASVSFAQITSNTQSYAFIASVALSGVNGVGYHVGNVQSGPHVVPLVGNMTSGQILLTHSGDFETPYSTGVGLTYNTTLVNFNQEDFTLQSLAVNDSKTLNSGGGYPCGNITFAREPGILIVGYNSTTTQGGFSLMPWGMSSLSYSVTFGSVSTSAWVSTDLRQVTIGGIAYQVKLSLWSTKGYQVT